MDGRSRRHWRNGGDIRSGINLFPSWSPDGTKLVFERIGDGIYVASGDGSNAVRLTTYSGGAESPSFSPDGTKIVFTRFGGNGGSSELWEMNTDGSGQTQLTTLGGFNLFPRFSPDGSAIVFQRNTTS